MAHNNIGITRQEALEAIARAICKVDNGSKGCCVKDCLLWKLATSKAEAALNALLEGGK